MNSTPASLLEQIRQRPRSPAWSRFAQLYTPLLFYWARKLGLDDADSADLVQEVFVVLVQKLPTFQYDPHRGFRNWLRTVLVNKRRDQLRRKEPVVAASFDELDALADDAPDVLSDTEYRQQLVAQALRLLEPEFSPWIWRVWQEHAVAGRPAPEVAAELGIAVGSVYVAKSRVLARLRRELEGLLD